MSSGDEPPRTTSGGATIVPSALAARAQAPWAREPRRPSPSVTDEDRTCPREMTRGPKGGLAPGVVRGRAVDRRHLASHGAQVGAELPAMMNRVEEEPPGPLGYGVLPGRATRHHQPGLLLPAGFVEPREPLVDAGRAALEGGHDLVDPRRRLRVVPFDSALVQQAKQRLLLHGQH